MNFDGGNEKYNVLIVTALLLDKDITKHSEALQRKRSHLSLKASTWDDWEMKVQTLVCHILLKIHLFAYVHSTHSRHKQTWASFVHSPKRSALLRHCFRAGPMTMSYASYQALQTWAQHHANQSNTAHINTVNKWDCIFIVKSDWMSVICFWSLRSL